MYHIGKLKQYFLISDFSVYKVFVVFMLSGELFTILSCAMGCASFTTLT